MMHAMWHHRVTRLRGNRSGQL